MVTVWIAITLGVVGRSLWVRRDTWRSSWEIGASSAIVAEAVALVLMSPWAATTLGPKLHYLTGWWNLPHLLGIISLIVATNAIIYHLLVRVADDRQLRSLFRRYVRVPTELGVVAMVTTFVLAGEEHVPDLFAHTEHGRWLIVYWLVAVGLIVYLSIYSARVLLIVRSDPRAKRTADVWLVSSAFGVAACLVKVVATMLRLDASSTVWCCVCLAVAIFAYGSAQSWRAKAARLVPDPTFPPATTEDHS